MRSVRNVLAAAFVLAYWGVTAYVIISAGPLRSYDDWGFNVELRA